MKNSIKKSVCVISIFAILVGAVCGVNAAITPRTYGNWSLVKTNAAQGNVTTQVQYLNRASNRYTITCNSLSGTNNLNAAPSVSVTVAAVNKNTAAVTANKGGVILYNAGDSASLGYTFSTNECARFTYTLNCPNGTASSTGTVTIN